MKKKLKKYTILLKQNKISLEDIQKSISGWLGYVKHANTRNLIKT